ncbi:hypothetical protein QYE76_064007 [Lolium multiflorum]|uniref:Acireductone dioxygenase n=2 Tax=Lolium multiflorum TaxID=4521 RepID=A0AAD8W9U1_LOLMU|nr:hypothetical protein QYE76_064007 [Lolium multiflorum]
MMPAASSFQSRAGGVLQRGRQPAATVKGGMAHHPTAPADGSPVLIQLIPLNMALQVWMVGENGEDLKNPKEFLPVSKLEEIGVLYWHLDPKQSESEEELSKIRKDRGYSYMDLLDICPGKLENYEEKLKNFFREHMHADEEIRYCLEGGGYFDVRNKDDKWIRIWIKEGDMIVLPAGIYHRFTLDTANHVKLMRLFIGEPVWTAHNRPQEDHPVRQEYVKNLTDNAGLPLAAH